jgi:peptidoglycan-associated lipoprotein
MHPKLTTLAAVALALGSASAAYAQDIIVSGERPMEKPLPAPTKALEIVVGTGYTQGLGSLESGVPLQDVITPGISADFGIGYRFDPRWSVSLAGQYQEFTAERATGARGFTPDIALTFHMSPYTRVDPWVQIATGYRFLWETHDAPLGTTLTHGFEPAKLTFGVDLRASRGVAIAPVVGADISLPLWQQVGSAANVAIENPTVSLFVFAGIQARFDATSTHAEPPHPVTAEAVQTTEITQAQVAPPPPPQEPMRPVSPSISISEEALKACNINLDSLDKAPKFDFDKSTLKAEDVPVLEKIAECFSTGPLKDSGVLLVGHTDPRGSQAYNQALGLRRANSVAAFLTAHGVKDDRIQKTSRGELDATGTDEASWARDRRVDVSRVEISISRR